MSKLVLTNLSSPPAFPAVSTVAVYSLGNVLYTMDSSGTITTLGGGGGSVTINTTAPLLGGTTGALFNLTFGFAGQLAGDLPVCTGAAWVRLPKSLNNGDVLTIVGGNVAWAAAVGGVTVTATANQGIVITGVPPIYSVGLSVTPQTGGTIIFRNGANTQWVGLNPVLNGDVLTLVGGVPAWVTPGGGGSVIVDAPLAGDGTGGNHVRIAPAGEANGDLLARVGGVWTRVAVGTPNQVLTVVGGVPAWRAPASGPKNLYVAGVTGSDAADGLSPGTPLKTLGRAMQFVPPALAQSCVIHCINNETITETVMPRWLLPGGGGFDAKFLAIDAPLVQFLAPDTVSLGSNPGVDLPTLKFGNVRGTAPYTPGALAGMMLDYLTPGPNQGVYRIANNDALDIFICGQFPAGPVVGVDQFRVVQESVLINLPLATPTEAPTFAGGFLILSGVVLNCMDNPVQLESTTLFLNAASIIGTTPGTVIVASHSQVRGLKTRVSDLYSVAPVLAAGPQRKCGPKLGLQFFCVGSNIQFYGAKSFMNMTLNEGCYLELDSLDMAGTGILKIDQSNAVMSRIRCLDSTAVGTLISVEKSSDGDLFFGAFTQLAPSITLALVVQNNSYMQAEGLTGTVAGPNAVVAQYHAQLKVADAGGVTTVMGSGGAPAAIKVGNNAPTSWAAILGGAPADCNDLASGFPTYTVVTT